MAVFLCRWPNGDISIVEARNKADADFKLDEFGNADQADLYQLRNFMMDFEILSASAMTADILFSGRIWDGRL